MKSLLLSLSYLLFAFLPLKAQNISSSLIPWANQPAPKHEVRAVWLTTIGGLDWPHCYAQSTASIARQKEELCRILDEYQRAGINTVLFQTRVRGTMLYPSAYEPWDGCLSGRPGTSPGYDALAFAIDECHRRGMELQAWVVSIPVGKWNGAGCRNLRKRFPSLLRRIGEEGYLNPEDPRTANYLAYLCEEITRNYDVDGIHLDYIRYPETWKIKVPITQARANITAIVRAVNSRVKAIKPWVKLSCAPIGKHDDLSRYWAHGWNARTRVAQDAQQWLAEGLMDELFPMMYFRNDQFFPFAIDWKEQSHGRIIAPGLGIYFLSPKEGNWQIDDVTREMEVLRRYGMGYGMFRGKFLTDNVQGILDFTQQFNAHPALVPPMTWAGARQPEAPQRVNIGRTMITWQGNAPYYNVYASRSLPVDINDGRNLVAARLNTKQLRVNTAGRHFVVTAMDRYGNESTPVPHITAHSSVAQSSPTLLPCNGRELTIVPEEQLQALDGNHLIVETLQGSIVATVVRRGTTVDVSTLPNGFYVLKSINRRGVSHRLGHFVVKR